MARTKATRKTEETDRSGRTVAAMDFLLAKRRSAIPAVVAIAGEVAFLRREALLHVRKTVLGRELNDFTYVVHAGDEIRGRDVFDDLWTPPMIGDKRLVVVQPAERKQRRRTEEAAADTADDAADDEAPAERGEDFVSQNRAALEKYVEHPAPSAVLLLDLRSFPATTKLYKAVQQSGLIVECAALRPHLVPGWCQKWARHRYGKELTSDAADGLVEHVGPHYGVLDQELDKLSTVVGDAAAIGFDVVQRLSAGAGVDKAFAILDAALDGDAAGALARLERQLATGDEPMRLVNIIISQLRKLTRAARLAVAGTHSLPQALTETGIRHFAVDQAALRLRRIGRERMAEMFRRLLAVDLAVKGGSGLGATTVLARLLRELAGLGAPNVVRK